MFEKHKAALEHIAEASEYGHIVRPSKKLERAEFPKAEVRTSLLLSCDAADEKGCMDARFGPTSLVSRNTTRSPWGCTRQSRM
ncbi:MAG: hypothetical protein H6948_07080 [Zoogloeaceae bacterium]|nr:hypothetical protein [Zoogloeaceae bacterium]